MVSRVEEGEDGIMEEVDEIDTTEWEIKSRLGYIKLLS